MRSNNSHQLHVRIARLQAAQLAVLFLGLFGMHAVMWYSIAGLNLVAERLGIALHEWDLYLLIPVALATVAGTLWAAGSVAVRFLERPLAMIFWPSNAYQKYGHEVDDDELQWIIDAGESRSHQTIKEIRELRADQYRWTPGGDEL